MTELALRQIQLIQRDILLEFVRLCEAEGLRYYLAGGTLLGAVLYEGFIPWDDDIDIKMPRSDYQRLLGLSGRLPAHLFLSPPGKERCEYTFLKIMDRRTLLIEDKGAVEKRICVYIDVFPMDGFPGDEQVRQRHMRSMQNLNTLFHGAVESFASLRKSASLKGRLLGGFGFALCKLGLTPWHIFQLMDKRARAYDYDACGFVGLTVEGNPRKEMFDKQWLAVPVKLPFEGHMLSAPSGYDEHLTIFYGDYRHLPKLPGHGSPAFWLEGQPPYAEGGE